MIRPKILTVDDSRPIRTSIGRAFQTYACQVIEAADGSEGLAVAARERPDLILLDLAMPVMDGLEMLVQLRADPELASIPVIMLSAETRREHLLRAAKLGVRDFLVKPFPDNDLVRRVGLVISLTQRSCASRAADHFKDEVPASGPRGPLCAETPVLVIMIAALLACSASARQPSGYLAMAGPPPLRFEQPRPSVKPVSLPPLDPVQTVKTNKTKVVESQKATPTPAVTENADTAARQESESSIPTTTSQDALPPTAIRAQDNSTPGQPIIDPNAILEYLAPISTNSVSGQVVVPVFVPPPPPQSGNSSKATYEVR